MSDQDSATMTGRLKVSVLLPVYNAGEYLEPCLDSVFGQTYDNIELISIDDGSTDGSADLLDRYAAMHGDRMVVVHQRNSGVSVTRNRAMGLASGEYLMFLDNDDYLDPDCVQTFVDALEGEEIDVVFGGYRRPDDSGRIRLEVVLRPEDEWAPYYVVAAWAKLIRTEFARESRLAFLETNIGEDAFFSLPAVTSAQSTRVISYCGYNWRFNEGSVSNTSQRSSEGLQFQYTMDSLLEGMRERDIGWNDELRHYFVRYVTWYVLYTCKGDGWQRASRTIEHYRGWLDDCVPAWDEDVLARPRRPRGDSLPNRCATWLFVRHPAAFRLAVRALCLSSPSDGGRRA